MKKKPSYSTTYHLDASSIDQMSEQINSVFQKAGLDTKAILRLRLSAEAVMGIWAQQLGEQTVCEFKTGSFLKRSFIQFKVRGDAINPKDYQDELYQDISNGSSISSKD